MPAAPPDDPNDVRNEQEGREEPLDSLLKLAFHSDDHDAARRDVSVLRVLKRWTGLRPHVRLRDVLDEPGGRPVVRPIEVDEESPPRAGGRYQLVGEIARGGMGVILKGRDVDLGRDVAFKVLKRRHARDPAYLERFLEEAQICGQLQHPGIVQVHEVGLLEDGRPYFTMELIAGQTLAARLEARRSPSDDRGRLIAAFGSVCQAIGYAHARGVVHRDLKPSNVIVGPFGEVLVVDWGLAKVLARGGLEDETQALRTDDAAPQVETHRSGSSGSRSVSGSVIGTPAYMAPEQARGEVDQIDERADVFALGAILCEIMTGRPPYVADSVGETKRLAAAADLTEALERLATSGADEGLVRLATDCLDVVPGQRPRDASVVARALEEHLTSLDERLRRTEVKAAVDAARAEEAEGRAAAERRARRLAVVSAVLVVLAVAVVVGGRAVLEKTRRDRRARTETSVASLLEEAVRLRDDARFGASVDLAAWSRALAAAERARDVARAGGAGASVLRRAEEAAVAIAHEETVVRSDEAMLRQLDTIRAEIGDDFSITTLDRSYRAAFAQYGVDLEGAIPSEAAERVRASAIAPEVITALEEWALWLGARPGLLARNPDRQVMLATIREVVDRADADPTRVEVRAAIAARDVDHLLALAGRSDDLPAATTDLIAANLRSLGRSEEALALWRHAVLRYPADYWLHHHLGDALVAEGPEHLDEGVGHLRAALAVRPESLATWILLGIALADHDAETALAAFERACSIAPERSTPHDDLVKFHSRRGDHTRALEEALRWIALVPDDPKAHFARARSARALGDAQAAAEAYREALRLHPEFASAHFGLAEVLKQRGDDEAVLAAYQEAVRHDPELAEAWCNMGQFLFATLGRYPEALDAYRKGDEAGSKRDVWRYPSGEWVRVAERYVDLEARLPAIADGDDTVTTASDWLVLSNMAIDRLENGRATRFIAEAFRVDPKLERQEMRRLNAARNALLAAHGTGSGVLTPDERDGVRAQALTWLEAELRDVEADWRAGAETAADVRHFLEGWKGDALFGTIRDKEALASVSAEQRERCLSLWKAVDDLLDRARSD